MLCPYIYFNAAARLQCKYNALIVINDADIPALVAQHLETLPLNGKRVLVLVPDHTRTMRLPVFFRALCKHLLPRVSRLDFLVALGTHPALDDASMNRLFGISVAERSGEYAKVCLLNHAWQDPAALTTLGTVSEDEVAEISEGLLRMTVPVRLNKAVLDCDHIIICGPVFPHEVVGMSGGNKYFFPGIAGEEVINFTHWLGALITSYDIIGVTSTPVRKMVDRAAEMIPTPRHALCVVISKEGIHDLTFGTPVDAHARAAAVSRGVHIKYVPHAFKQVLSVLPEMYDEIWVGAKGMYKLEPVIADGGEVILFAPHIHDFSETHGRVIRQIGYHVRDYFAKRWDQFKYLPWGVIAHSTHVRGKGEYDLASGIELPRINVTLATGISEAECKAVTLGYRDPRSIDVAAWSRRQNRDLMVVPQAGETLFRLEAERT